MNHSAIMGMSQSIQQWNSERLQLIRGEASGVFAKQGIKVFTLHKLLGDESPPAPGVHFECINPYYVWVAQMPG